MIVLDAAGTLLALAEPVGETYAALARAAGADLGPSALEAGFADAMRAAPPLAFGVADPVVAEAAERAWWRAVARHAVAVAGAPPGALDFDRFFDAAWAAFARPGAWLVHDDVRPVLRGLRARGIPLAVFSNWDGRLPGVLAGLGVKGFFARVLVSSRVGAAKPELAAYEAVAEALATVAGERAPVMVGDRIDHDVEPALAAGWEAVWLDRRGRGGAAPAGARRIETLAHLPALVTA